MSTPIDTKTIRRLAEILNDADLSELEFEGENFRICLSKETGTVVTAAPVAAPVAAPAPAPVAAAAPAAAPAADADFSNDPDAVKSPMVGVVYSAPEPSVPDYIKVGDKVNAGDTIFLIEAMKTFNPVKATKSGTVKQILVENGSPVEFGEPMVIIG